MRRATSCRRRVYLSEPDSSRRQCPRKARPLLVFRMRFVEGFPMMRNRYPHTGSSKEIMYLHLRALTWEAEGQTPRRFALTGEAQSSIARLKSMRSEEHTSELQSPMD